MNGGVVAELLGQMVPLAAASHLIDDAVERCPWVGAIPARPTGRVQLVQNGFDDRPQFVADFPNRGKRFNLAFLSGLRGSLKRGPTGGYRLKRCF